MNSPLWLGLCIAGIATILVGLYLYRIVSARLDRKDAQPRAMPRVKLEFGASLSRATDGDLWFRATVTNVGELPVEELAVDLRCDPVRGAAQVASRGVAHTRPATQQSSETCTLSSESDGPLNPDDPPRTFLLRPDRLPQPLMAPSTITLIVRSGKTVLTRDASAALTELVLRMAERSDDAAMPPSRITAGSAFKL